MLTRSLTAAQARKNPEVSELTVGNVSVTQSYMPKFTNISSHMTPYLVVIPK